MEMVQCSPKDSEYFGKFWQLFETKNFEKSTKQKEGKNIGLRQVGKKSFEKLYSLYTVLTASS